VRACVCVCVCVIFAISGPPSSPRNLRVVDRSDDCVTLSWKAPENYGEERLLGYEIEAMLEGEAYHRAGYVSAGREVQIQGFLRKSRRSW